MRESALPLAPGLLPSLATGKPTLSEACFFQAEPDDGVALGTLTTKALVMARHMAREATEASVPVIVLRLLLLLLGLPLLIPRMKAARSVCCCCCCCCSLRISRVGVLVQRLMSIFFPLASCYGLPARMQRENRADPIAADRSRSSDPCCLAAAFFLRDRSDGLYRLPRGGARVKIMDSGTEFGDASSLETP